MSLQHPLQVACVLIKKTMSIIEIACFRLESSELPVTSKPFLADIPYDKPTATLRFYLSHAIRSLSKNSKHPFYLLQDIEDNLTIYYVGMKPKDGGNSLDLKKQVDHRTLQIQANGTAQRPMRRFVRPQTATNFWTL